jgi:hypothetical protein
VHANLVTPGEARTADHLATPIGEQLAAYIARHEAGAASEKYVRESRRILNAVLGGCEFRTLADLARQDVERRLNRRRSENASARTRKTDRSTLIAFANWCANPTVGRLVSNPFDGVPESAGSFPIRSMGCLKLTREPTLASAAERCASQS